MTGCAKDVIHEIMCNGRIDMSAVERRHGIRFDDYFAEQLRRLRILQEDGLVEIHARCVDLTPVGRLLMRSVAMTFDAYLPTGEAPRAARA